MVNMLPKKRKKELNVHQEVGGGSTINSFKVKLLSADNLEIDVLRSFAAYLADSRDNDREVELVRSNVDHALITSMLSNYGASELAEDKAINDILFILERSYSINLQPLFPLIWDKKAVEYYTKLRQLGPTLHARYTADQVLDLLDPNRLWLTLLKSEQTSVCQINCDPSRLYDARFISRLLATLLEPGNEISCRKFVEVNGLSFACAATSFFEPNERSVAYVILRRFLSQLKDLTTELFAERCFYVHLLVLLRNSIEKPNIRLPHVISHFFARVCKLLLHPEDPVYAPVTSFLLLKPSLDLENVPDMYKMLFSSSTEHHHEERQWLLRLICDSMIEPCDYNILQKRYGVRLCLSFFTSNMADMGTRKMILLLLKSALQHKSVAKDLFGRQNLHSWIATAIMDNSLTRWEVVFLCELYVQLLKQIKEIAAEQQKHHGEKTDVKFVIAQNTCRLLGKNVLGALKKEDDEGKHRWFSELQNLMDEPWQTPQIF